MSENNATERNKEFIGEFLALIDKYAPYMLKQGVEIGCEHYAENLSIDALLYAVAMYLAHIARSGTATQAEINIYLKKALDRVSELALYLEFITDKRENGGGKR